MNNRMTTVSESHSGNTVDRVESLDGAVVQHGHLSDRVYLLEPGASALSDVALMERLGRQHAYTKLFAKIPEDRADAFLAAGFHIEARIPEGAGESDLIFCSQFLSPERAIERFPDDVSRALREAIGKGTPPQSGGTPIVASGCQQPCIAGLPDAEELAALYREAFASYPFPIHDPQFVRESMNAGTVYIIIRNKTDGRLIAAASAEPSCHPLTYEMTDFATTPEKRGLGLASVLLRELEHEITSTGKHMAFTIARATSTGMNIVFARQGYTYAGTLVNNTNIAGRIESMNVWYRSLI